MWQDAIDDFGWQLKSGLPRDPCTLNPMSVYEHSSKRQSSVIFTTARIRTVQEGWDRLRYMQKDAGTRDSEKTEPKRNKLQGNCLEVDHRRCIIAESGSKLQ